jgi:hypothetical protein
MYLTQAEIQEGGRHGTGTLLGVVPDFHTVDEWNAVRRFTTQYGEQPFTLRHRYFGIDHGGDQFGPSRKPENVLWAKEQKLPSVSATNDAISIATEPAIAGST